jgi:hypothetical protein
MIKELKNLLKKTSIYSYVKYRRKLNELSRWEKSDSKDKLPLPHILKQFTVRDYGRKYGCTTLIETGTYEGDMVKAMRKYFKTLFSIELDQTLHQQAQERFKNDPSIHLVQGNSGEKIKEVLKEIKSPALFWLDGHYSEGYTAKGDIETPVVLEIQHIFDHSVKGHVILVDDARCFDGTHDYPILNSFIANLKEKQKDIRVDVYNDIIRITPNVEVVL